jgi:hypothetical protein
MLLPINLLIIDIIAYVWVPSGQSLLFQLFRLLILLSLLFLTLLLQQWFPMTIMCLDLKNLTKNLGMILQAPAHLQHLLFLLHMTPCDAGWMTETPQRRTGRTPMAIPCQLIDFGTLHPSATLLLTMWDLAWE